MADELKYTDRVKDGSFLDLVDDKEFQTDLVRFFSGGRYNMSQDEMREIGIEGLANKFVEHMRIQEWNEVTAMKDYNYVINKDLHRAGKESFGRLMSAWDNSDEVGSGFWTGAGDYFEGIATAPSTYAGLGSLGIGKIAAKAGTKAAQMAVRGYVKNLLAKNVVGRTAALGAATGAVTEGAMGAGMGFLTGETREEVIPGFEYTGADVAKDALVGAVFGGALGAAGGYLKGKTDVAVDTMKSVQESARLSDAQSARQAAVNRFRTATGARQQDAAQRVADIEATLSAAAGNRSAKVRDPLDPEKVLAGNDLLKKMSDPNFDGVFSSGLSLDTMRSLTAATLDIVDELGITEKDRITSVVANKIRNGDVEILSRVDEVRQRYNLSKEQFSLIYLAEVSNAGKILAEQSLLSRAARKVKSAEYKGLGADLNELAQNGISTFNDQIAAELSAQVVQNSAKKGKLGTALDYTRELDAMRIAFMTSQVATTVRNASSTMLLAGVDVADEFFRGLVRGEVVTDPGKTLKRMTATLRGATWNKAQAKVLQGMFAEEMPQTYASVFNDAMRLEVGTSSNSNFAKAGRFVNVFNTALDTTFKQAAFFASLDRQLADQGITVGQFIASGKRLEDLGEDTIRKAYDDANRFTMQRTYADDDSAFGKTARFAVNANRKVPFLVSGALGIPFPRYVANHLEMMSDYAPIWGHMVAKTVGSDPIKTSEDRIVRQMTGASMLALGYMAAAEKDGEVDYKSIKTAIGGQADISSSLGFIVGHMYLGDILYRTAKGMPLPNIREIETVLGGVGDFSADFTLVKELVSSASEGRVTEGLQKGLGNIAATFTYPLVLSRDVVGQFDYDAAGNPYIRNVYGQGVGDKKGDVSLLGEETNFQTFVGQATRFLPDTKMLQYTQSFNGENDIPMFSILNPAKVGAMNPLLKQITGVQQQPPMTDLEKEFNVVGLKEYDIYKPYATKNPTTHYMATYSLSQGLHKEFDDWKKNVKLGGLAKGKTYDELGDNYDEKKKQLEAFVKDRIGAHKQRASDFLQDAIGKNKKSAEGYIRNMYDIKRHEMGVEYFDEATSIITRGNYRTAKDWLLDSESPLEELNKRLAIMDKSGDIRGTE